MHTPIGADQQRLRPDDDVRHAGRGWAMSLVGVKHFQQLTGVAISPDNLRPKNCPLAAARSRVLLTRSNDESTRDGGRDLMRPMRFFAGRLAFQFDEGQVFVNRSGPATAGDQI